MTMRTLTLLLTLLAPAAASAQALVHFPAADDHALLLLEDQWPTRGDFDFNDAVVAYHYTYALDANGDVTQIRATVRPLAAGADTIQSGIALSFPMIDRARVRSVRVQQAGAVLTGAHLLASESRAVIKIADDIKGLFPNASGVLNANNGDTLIGSETVEISACFSPPIPTCATADDIDERADGCLDLGTERDLFFFRTGDFSHQVHMPQFGGTDAMNMALLNTSDDASNEARAFIDSQGIPFVLSLPSGVDYPAEGIDIDQLYPGIGTFGASGGTQCTGFFRDTGCGGGVGVPVRSNAFTTASGGGRLPFALLRSASEFPMTCAVVAPAAGDRPPLPGEGTCTRAPSISVLTNVAAFEGTHHDRIAFDAADEQDAASIAAKFGNLSKFTIGGGRAAVRRFDQHAQNFAGEGTEGGPTSGTHRVDWGYYGLSVVAAEFVNPVQAAGGMFGGSVGHAFVEVTLEDGCTQRVKVSQAGLSSVPNGATGCDAINGFLGLASTDERKIVRVRFGNMRDASSLDDVYVGNAAPNVGAGATPLAEVGFTAGSCPGAIGASLPPAPAADTCATWQRDCSGTCFGTAVMDSCYVCGGDDACLGGSGVPGHVLPPVVSGGACADNERDCTGVCFGQALVDSCGVCNGDGTSCLPAPAAPVGVAAPVCASGIAPVLDVFTHVADFDGLPHTRITFDPTDERDGASIAAKYPNLASFSIGGARANVLPTGSHAQNFAGEGTEGGPTSGTYRVDWGYYGRSNVTADFVNPVDAAGAMFGGGAGSQQMIVTLEDGCQARILMRDYLPAVANGTNGCGAINGFLGVATADGRRIQKVTFSSSRDASSLDDVLFGSANAGSNGAGPMGFPEVPFTASGCNAGTEGGSGTAPAQAVSTPPAAPSAGSCPTASPADCTGACGGSATVDDCGVCNGDNSCWAVSSGTGATARCSNGSSVNYHLITNEAAFTGATHDVITFEPTNERSAIGVRDAFPNLGSFSIQGGRGAIRHTSQHATNFGGEGTEGGAVSGSYRIDWGYYGLTAVDMGFISGVQGVGAMYGGSVRSAALRVILSDGCEVRIGLGDSPLASIPNGAGACAAINGFMGIALDPAETRTIVSARLSSSRDASSVDDIYFGAVADVAVGPGPTPLPENGFTCGPPPPAACDDGIRNGGEQDVDCGGPCAACPSCTDGVRNGGETGVDCGGTCGACASCSDGIPNGDETGVDCGGSCGACPTCGDGVQNQGEGGVDCGGPCTACPSCSDGIQNQDEAGVDCGGVCGACPTCSDGVQNQGETGIDCGGPCGVCVSATPCSASGCTCIGVSNAPRSCLDIKTSYPSSPDGFYCIDPATSQNAVSTYCDMSTDGGGWTALVNVTAKNPPRTGGADLLSNYMLPDADISNLGSSALEIRMQCAVSGKNIDVKTSDDLWVSRPYSNGDGCAVGYRWRPPVANLTLLPGNNYSIVSNGWSGGCCCRVGHPLLTHGMGIGPSITGWMINDTYYNRWNRYCAGSANADFHRIYYR